MSPAPPPRNSELVRQLEALMGDLEGENLEFKEARGRYSLTDLCKYCCALANEGGGKVVLGVTDRRPRRVVGSAVFAQLERTRGALMEKIPLRIDVSEIAHPDGRVLLFDVPSRPIGVPMKYEGVYWSRNADSLVPVAEDRLRLIFAETANDFSAEVCADAGLDDLDAEAIEEFRRRWAKKSGNDALASMPTDQLLRDAELIVGGGVTYAALVLFGTRDALGRLLPQAEVVFEYRSSDAAGPAQQREEYRQGFFGFHDGLYGAIGVRNDLQHYQDGLFVYDIPTFAERPIREVILNAVSHRNYQFGGSVFVRQYPRRLVVESPGGLPVGITLENVLDRQAPRNRRIAEALGRCGLVERSGQGMNLMFEQSISQGKSRPDFTGTDDFHVVVTLNGEVRDPTFVRFMERIGQEAGESFDVHDFLVLDLIHREEPVDDALRPRLGRLVDLGIIERRGRGRAVRHMLSRRFYVLSGKRGSYTRRRGLDWEEHKALLVRHLRDAGEAGSPISELQQVLTSRSREQIRRMLRELRDEGRVQLVGVKRAARWFASGEV